MAALPQPQAPGLSPIGQGKATLQGCCGEYRAGCVSVGERHPSYSREVRGQAGAEDTHSGPRVRVGWMQARDPRIRTFKK